MDKMEIQLIQIQDDTWIHKDGGDLYNFKGKYGEKFQLKIEYYEETEFKKWLSRILYFFTLGLLFVMQRWWSSVQIWLRLIPSNYQSMTHVIVTKTSEDGSISRSQLIQLTEQKLLLNSNIVTVKIIMYEYLKFYFNSDDKLQALTTPIEQLTCKQIHEYPQDLNTKKRRQLLLQTFGQNKLEIADKGVMKMFIDEVLSPFNFFQIGSFIVWCMDDYVMFALLILGITTLQIITQLQELLQNQQRIRDMILQQSEVRVLNQEEPLNSFDLVPGDVVRLVANSKVPCDCILIQGSCVINEAIITGEAIPVMKECIQPNDQQLDPLNQQYMLLKGTICLDVNNAIALVYQTGFQTLKGQLARSILFTECKTFSFAEDSIKYLWVLFGFGMISIAFTLKISLQYGYSTGKCIIKALEILTICVPPQLPLALGAGVQLALLRLKNKQVTCIKPDKINVGGKINACGFDKTGTLTEPGLQVYGCKPSKQVKNLGFTKRMAVQCLSTDHIQMLHCLASCHSLALINGQILGDPLDLKMFQETNFSLSIVNQIYLINTQSTEIFILKRFEFQAQLQRMSVIAKVRQQHYVYTKGSPEIIQTLCLKESIPRNYIQLMKKYALQGLRIIACAYKLVDQPSDLRAEIENKLIFVGFLIFENRLKPESTPTIILLKERNFMNFMVTGDNELTAINIANKCQIFENNLPVYLAEVNSNQILDQDDIDWQLVDYHKSTIQDDFDQCSFYSSRSTENKCILSTQEVLQQQCNLAMTGRTFGHLLKMKTLKNDNKRIKDLVGQILERTRVYARMKPIDKGTLVNELKLKYCVAFCGDGANDTQALKNADVGLALSEEDASLAAPFTSNVDNISSMIPLIKESRASLVTCVECFKFMTLYSIIQTMIVLLCYYSGSDLTQSQYLSQDLFIVLTLAITMNLTSAADEIANYSPISNLRSIPVLASVIGNSLICFIFIMITYNLLYKQTWYRSYLQIYPLIDNDDNHASYDNQTLTMVSCAQCMAVALAFTRGEPFRQQIHKNKYFSFNVLFCIIFIIYFTLNPGLPIFVYLTMSIDMPISFSIIIIGLMVANIIVIIIYERVIVEWYIKNYKE